MGSKQILSAGRIPEIDFIKGIAIMMVVIGHTNCPSWLDHIICLVHMPLFFMASGFLSFKRSTNGSRSNIISYLLRKVKSLYLPFVCCSSVVYVLYYSLGWFDSDIESFIRQILKFVAFGQGVSCPLSIQHLWFLKTLFIVSIVYYLLEKYIKNAHWQIYALFVCLPSLFFLLPPPFFVNVLWPIRALFYFILGYFIRKINLNIPKWYLVLFALLWVSLGLYWNDVHVDMRFSIGFLSGSMVIGSIVAFLFLFNVTKLIFKTSFFDFFCFCGRTSIYIYLFHYPLFFIFSKLFFAISIDSCVVDDIYWGVYVLLVLIPAILCFYVTKKDV